MNLHNIWQLVKSDNLKLLPIMALAFYIAFIPHNDYPYAVHIDEWVHMAYTEAILKAGSATFVDPFWGQATLGLSSNLEAGFHVFLGTFHQISGISWMTIFKYFPGIIFIITILSAYILGRRIGFGWEAALFTCLIPTTVGILGPGFLVPVAMALLFILMSLFLAFNFKTACAYLVLFIFTCFLVSMHAPSAICVVIVLIHYILLNLKGNLKHSLGITLAIIIPFLAPFPWIFDKLLPTAKLLFTPHPILEYVDLPLVLQTYGYLPIGLCLLGTFLLTIKGGKGNHGLVLGLLALMLMLVLRYSFHYGIDIVYFRGLTYMMLLMGILAGAGLMGLKSFNLPERLGVWLKMPIVTKNVGNILCLALIGATLAVSIPDRQNTPYYYMIDSKDYEAFVWIKENMADKYDRAVLDPWKATAFTAITGKHVYTRIHSYSESTDAEAYAFLHEDCRDTSFLRENRISIVYTTGSCNNPFLVKQEMKYVYLLTEVEGIKD